LFSFQLIQGSYFFGGPRKLVTAAITLGSVGVGGNYGVDYYQTERQYQQTQQIFKQLGVRHINHLESKDPHIIPINQKYHRAICQVIANQEDGLIRHGFYTADQLSKIKKQVQRDDLGLRKDLKLRYINENKGHGVFATKQVPVDSVVGIYAGEICHNSQIADSTYAFTSLHVYEDGMIYGATKLVGLEMQVDAKKAGNITRFINAPSTQSQANCFALNVQDKNNNPQVVFVTTRSVKPGEELTIDYGPTYSWKDRQE
jgi:hypothetical protein